MGPVSTGVGPPSQIDQAAYCRLAWQGDMPVQAKETFKAYKRLLAIDLTAAGSKVEIRWRSDEPAFCFHHFCSVSKRQERYGRFLIFLWLNCRAGALARKHLASQRKHYCAVPAIRDLKPALF